MKDDDLDALRKQIDSLDKELLDILGRRMDVVAEVGRYKKARGLELRDEQRMQALLAAQLLRAESLHLPKEFVTELYALVYKFALVIEAEV